MVENNQTRMGRKKQQNKKNKKKSLWKRFFHTIIFIMLLLGIGVAVLFTYYIATAPKIDAEKLSDPFSSQILDEKQEIVAEPGREKRTKIVYDDLPDVLVDAVTATEDSRFFEHPGIDLRRIGGAIVANFKNGFGSEGASTITQQVAENSFLKKDKKIKLKVQEQWLALKLERQYSKEQILEMYLNKIFYGNNAYGVASASKTYFGKSDLHDLTLPEAAILAGLPQRPTAYNPFRNPELTKERMDTVLTLMVRHEKISEAEAEEARNVDIESLLTDKTPEGAKYEAFIQQVKHEVEEKLDGADIYTDGLKIYTTLNSNAQKYVETLLKDSEKNPIQFPNESMQAAMTVIDTHSGAIKAIGGRRNSEGKDELNYAQKSYQPASTAKPLIAYGPAIEYNKWSTYHQLNDDKPYDNNVKKPINNVTRTYQGWVSARYALTHSLNVPALKTFDEVGAEKASEFTKGLGLEYDGTIGAGDVIGGTGNEFSPIEMAGAYQAFGNEGVFIEPHTVTKVEFPDGKVVDLTPEPEAAMSDYTAYMVTDMLKSVVQEGTGRAANIAGIPIAGKTGTSDDSKDSWFIGYSPNYTISVWTGNYDEDENKVSIPSGYTTISRDLFRHTMTELSKNIETPDFKMPKSVVKVGVEKGSNPPSLPSDYTPSSKIAYELFVKGTEPKKESVTYEKLDPVQGLKAKFDDEKQSIKVEWSYKEKDGIEFEVSSRVNNGEMKVLSTTSEESMDISNVTLDTEYEIQVVAVKDNLKSDPKTVKIQVGDIQENDEVDEPIPSVQNLRANYKDSIIQVHWSYDGPPATFEVSVNGQKEMKTSTGVDIKGAEPGQTYKIDVRAIGKESDGQSEVNSVTITVPQEEAPEEKPENEDENQENEQEQVDSNKENEKKQEENQVKDNNEKEKEEEKEVNKEKEEKEEEKEKDSEEE